VRTDLVLKGTLSTNPSFQGGETGFVLKGPIYLRGRSTCILPKKTMYDGSCTHYLIVSL
jgi:hypothetical protein